MALEREALLFSIFFVVMKLKVFGKSTLMPPDLRESGKQMVLAVLRESGISPELGHRQVLSKIGRLRDLL